MDALQRWASDRARGLLRDSLQLINTYSDPPKTLEELQQDAQNPQPGYNIHHIVEQTPVVSGRHCMLAEYEHGFALEDLGSTNGSRVNGRWIEGAEVLRPGDEIEIGSTSLTFELE